MSHTRTAPPPPVHCLSLTECPIWAMIMTATIFAIPCSMAIGYVSSSVQTSGHLRMGNGDTERSNASMYVSALVLLTVSRMVNTELSVG